RERVTVSAILKAKGSDVLQVPADARVGDVIQLLATERIGAVPVMAGDQVAGIFSERDLVHVLAAHGPAALDMVVGEAMTAPAISVTSAEPVIGALTLMTRRRIRHLPVVED